MIARHPLYTPTTGSRVGSNQGPPYPSHPPPETCNDDRMT